MNDHDRKIFYKNNESLAKFIIYINFSKEIPVCQSALERKMPVTGRESHVPAFNTAQDGMLQKKLPLILSMLADQLLEFMQ